MNGFYLHKSESIGEIFRSTLFNQAFGMLSISFYVLLFLIPILIAAYYFHRKTIAYSFFAIYPIIFLATTFFNKDDKLSDALYDNILFFYAGVFLTIIGFFASTYFNKKKKRILVKKDYLPIIVVILISFLLSFLPIRSGHLVCKIPWLSRGFTCDFWGQTNEEIRQGWFVF